MSEQEKYIEQIDQYLHGKMAEKERLHFEAELNTNTTLKELFDFVSDTEKALDINETESLKRSLAQTEQFLKKRKKNGLILKIAASIILTATLGYFLYQTNHIDSQTLYTEYYQAYPNVASPVSRSDKNVTNAYQVYENGDYQAALNMLEKQESKTDTVSFYLAQAQQALNLNKEAERNLSAVDDNSVFYDPAQWYLALLYLKTEDLKKCRSKLSEIVKAENSYSDRAGQLLDAL